MVFDFIFYCVTANILYIEVKMAKVFHLKLIIAFINPEQLQFCDSNFEVKLIDAIIHLIHPDYRMLMESTAKHTCIPDTVGLIFISGEKPFKCDQCDFACIQSFDLVKHKFTHSGDKPYKCDVCPKQFTRPARLRDHMRTHTGEKPYICDICGKGFAIQTGLKSHQASGIITNSYERIGLITSRCFGNQAQ